MPVVFRERGFAFFFYSNEGTPREKPHIHVAQDGKEAKFWLQPAVKLAYNDGYDARTLRNLAELIAWRREQIERRWGEFFSQGKPGPVRRR